VIFLAKLSRSAFNLGKRHRNHRSDDDIVTLYHGTAGWKVPLILKHGLKFQRSSNSNQVVFATPNKNIAFKQYSLGVDDGRLLEIRMPKSWYRRHVFIPEFYSDKSLSDPDNIKSDIFEIMFSSTIPARFIREIKN